MYRYGYGYSDYVPVAQRKARARAQLKKMEKEGFHPRPVELSGRKIAATFWGKAWCDNLESYMDYENRLPRGRSYVRNGSVLHLDIRPGEIEAMVAGTSLYKVRVRIAPAPQARWKALCGECAGRIGSLVELLSGRLSGQVMAVMTRRESGLFPSPKEIQMTCTCPDWACMCKHVAAVLYGVGARLDQDPGLLFLLRSVDQNQLISQAVETDVTAGANTSGVATLAADELQDVFGLDLGAPTVLPAAPQKAGRARKTTSVPARKKKRAVRKARGPKKAGAKKAAPKKRGRPKGARDKQPRRRRAV